MAGRLIHQKLPAESINIEAFGVFVLKETRFAESIQGLQWELAQSLLTKQGDPVRPGVDS